jgi:hypothetical protein
MSMLDRLIDRVGDSNPQIFRELKERLTLRNTAIAVAVALVIQVLVLVYVNSQIPISGLDKNSSVYIHELERPTTHKYCNLNNFKPKTTYYNNSPKICQLDINNNFRINWQFWRSDIFECLSLILPLGLILGSAYLLVADLVREKDRDTLNFVRLSPQSAQQIFIGKILSVPILIYVATAVMLPLHLLMGLGSGRSLLLLAGWYATICAMWFLLSSAAVLNALLGGIQAILTVIITAYPLYSSLPIINFYTLETIYRDQKLFNEYGYVGSGLLSFNNGVYTWFGVTFTSSAISFNAFVIGSCLVASYWVWQVLARRYRHPTSARIGRSQSFIINFCLQVWIAGLAFPEVGKSNHELFDRSGLITQLAVIEIVAILILIWMLLPSGQALQDGRYDRESVTHQRHMPGQSYTVQDSVKNDSSTASGAIATNIFMVLVLWLLLLAGEVLHMIARHST